MTLKCCSSSLLIPCRTNQRAVSSSVGIVVPPTRYILLCKERATRMWTVSVCLPIESKKKERLNRIRMKQTICSSLRSTCVQIGIFSPSSTRNAKPMHIGFNFHCGCTTPSRAHCYAAQNCHRLCGTSWREDRLKFTWFYSNGQTNYFLWFRKIHQQNNKNSMGLTASWLFCSVFCGRLKI